MNTDHIAEVLSKSRVIGLGESTHGTHEFFNFKSRLFQQLATSHGFNTLLFEDSPKACRLINDYIAGKDISLGSAHSQLYSVWQTEELEQLFLWMKNYRLTAEVEFVGFDVDQTKEGDLSSRDELMAKNIKTYCQGHPEAKVVVWAHNSHIQSVGSDIQPAPMGVFLKEWFGDQYQTVALLFGEGGVSATRLEDNNIPTPDRSLSTIKIGPPSGDLAEFALDALRGDPVFITQAQIADMNLPNKVRSIGWGLVPELANGAVEGSDLKRAFDYVVYFTQSTPSCPLPSV